MKKAIILHGLYTEKDSKVPDATASEIGKLMFASYEISAQSR
jgi:hypothetical protein